MMSRAADFHANADEMMRRAEAATLPIVKERYRRAAEASRAVARRLERMERAVLAAPTGALGGEPVA